MKVHVVVTFPNLSQFQYNGSNMIFDDGTGTVRIVVTCNAAGTAWTYMGTPVTSASCALF